MPTTACLTRHTCLICSLGSASYDVSFLRSACSTLPVNETGVHPQTMREMFFGERPACVRDAEQEHADLLGSKKESHIYVESRSERSVQDALEGLRDVLFNRAFVRVPHAEMTDAITVKDTAPHHLKPGSWVRIKSVGVYKGDLAQVEEVDAEGGVTVKVIPRVDYQAIAERCARALHSSLLGTARACRAAALQ